MIEVKDVDASGIKIVAIRDGSEVGRAYLYVLHNDLHKEPFGLLEDVFVEEEYRGQGISKEILAKLHEVAKEKGCYKIVCTSRFEKDHIHEYYQKLGYKKMSYGFRLDLK